MKGASWGTSGVNRPGGEDRTGEGAGHDSARAATPTAISPARLGSARNVPAAAAPAARSPQWGVAVLLALAFGVGAAVARRPDVAVFGVLFALVAASGLAPRLLRNAPALSFTASAGAGPHERSAPGDDPGRRLVTFHDSAADGGAAHRGAANGGAADGGVTHGCAESGPARLMTVRALAPGSRESAVVASTAEALDLGIRVPLGGKRDILDYRVSVFSADLGACRDELETGTLSAMLQPAPEALRRLPLPTALRSHAGAHHGRLRGGGTQVRDVGPMVPGDDLRHIDWRATARSGNAEALPLVRRHQAPADAAITLAFDVRVDIPALVAGWTNAGLDVLRQASSLQQARTAAGSLAAAYLAAGDRVGLLDAFGFGPALRPSGGARQLELVRRRLAGLTVASTSVQPSRPPAPPVGTLVYFFSPLLEPGTAEVAARWVRSGHVLAVVDTLPALDTAGLPAPESQALSLLLAARMATLATLDAEGITVLPAGGLREAVEGWTIRRARSHSAPGGAR